MRMTKITHEIGEGLNKYYET